MNILDLLFVKIYRLYENFGERDLLFFYAGIIMSVILSFDIWILLTVMEFFGIIIFNVNDSEENWLLVLGIVVAILIYLIYYPTRRARRIVENKKLFSFQENVLVYGVCITTVVITLVIAILKRNGIM